MQNFDDETMPLVPTQRSPGFFQALINPLKKYLTPKSLAIAVTSGVSTITYYDPSIKAGASVAEWLKYPAAILGGIGTNFTFNLQSYNELLQQCPALLKMPFQLSLAIFFSIACVAPNLFMNIVDEEGNYIDGTNMTLQVVSALLNIGVNIVGSMELINSISSLLKNKTDKQKEKLIEEINLVIEQFAQSNSQSDPNEPLNEELQRDLISQFKTNNDLSLCQKINYYSLNASIGLFSIPQFTAYLLISYLGMRDLSEKKFGTTSSISIFLGLIAAIGNGIPGAGFSIKGVNSISKKLMSLEKPSLLAVLFVLPALFSGFTTHKAMADSLKELGYSGNTAEALKWIANLGAALIYNLPQMLALANNLNTPAVSIQLHDLKENLEDQVKNLDSSNIQNFKTVLPNIVSSFFTDYASPETMHLQNYDHPNVGINNV